MVTRIREDIRFYLPADPYYYQVDNLPLEDLLANDISLQNQIDEINSAERGNTVGRSGFTDLQPYIDTSLPGTVSVRPGNFIGRAQRTSGGGLNGQVVKRANNGQWEVNTPPTLFGTGTAPIGDYAVSNPPVPAGSNPGNYVGRNSLFNFLGGNVTIDSFNFNDFEVLGNTAPPLGRIDLIGITTVNGAFDDPYLPGNPPATGVNVGDGSPKLAVVKGAGITTNNNGVREVIVGEKYITVGTPQEDIDDFGRNLEGNIIPNPTWGTVPMPDDVVNANFARDMAHNNLLQDTLSDWAESNKNASFFVPLAYVYVPQSHVAGNPIPQSYLKDIRPFFRTAELALSERQAIAMAVSPSVHNPMVTQQVQDNAFDEIVAWNGNDTVQAQLDEIGGRVSTLQVSRQVWIEQYTAKAGYVGNTTIDITAAILEQDIGKPIESINYRIRPYGGTGDIGNGWIGIKTDGTNRWYMFWRNKVKHSSAIGVQVVTFTAPPEGSSSTQLLLRTIQTGSNQRVYWYIDGYTIMDTLTV